MVVSRGEEGCGWYVAVDLWCEVALEAADDLLVDLPSVVRRST
jgi:hypothetical protein